MVTSSYWDILISNINPSHNQSKGEFNDAILMKTAFLFSYYFIFITLMCTIPPLQVVINNMNLKMKEAICFIALQGMVHIDSWQEGCNISIYLYPYCLIISFLNQDSMAYYIVH